MDFFSVARNVVAMLYHVAGFLVLSIPFSFNLLRYISNRSRKVCSRTVRQNQSPRKVFRDDEVRSTIMFN